MRAHGVVIDAPASNEHLCFGDVREPVFVQAFVANLAVELSTKAFSMKRSGTLWA